VLNFTGLLRNISTSTAVSAVMGIYCLASLFRLVNRAEIPVYFLHDRYDHAVSWTLAKRCFEAFQAPGKAFFTFGHSAQSPHFEEPERVREVVERILKGNRIKVKR